MVALCSKHLYKDVFMQMCFSVGHSIVAVWVIQLLQCGTFNCYSVDHSIAVKGKEHHSSLRCLQGQQDILNRVL